MGEYGGAKIPLITVGERLDDIQKSFNKVEMSAVVVSEYARFFETNLPIYIGREPKMPLKDIWPRTRDFI